MLRPRKKISHRFFLAIVLIAVVPIGIMGYESALLARKTLTNFAFLHMATIAETRANHLDSWLEERLNDLGVLSRLPAIREACIRYRKSLGNNSEPPTALLVDTLNILEGRSPSYENITVSLPDGKIVATTHHVEATLPDLHELEAIEHLQPGEEPALSAVYQIPGKEGWHVQLASRIDGPEGTRLAYLIAVLDLSKTIDPIMIERSGLGDTGETYLVNEDRKIISQSRFLDWQDLIDRSFDTEGIRSVLEKKNGTAVYENYLGREVLGSYVWLPNYNWGILAEMETEEILQPLEWIEATGVLTAILVSLVCLLMAYFVSRRISKPIVQVADAAEGMATGNLDQRISFASGDEIGRLAASFNIMAQQLSQSVASLRHKEESLQKAYDELVSAQEQIMRSERMAAVGELVASVAHEMRSPLSSIKLNLQIIGRSLAKETDLFEHYEIALDQAAQMERMFSELLNYSKPLDIQKKDIRLEPLLGRCLQELEGETTARRLAVELRMAPDLPPIIGDPDKIEQVFLNILKNAMEASEPEGRIEVSARSEKTVAGIAVTVAVADCGSGISPRNLKTIFKPFFTTKKKGTGLGLTIVKKIVDAHRGDISIESGEGRGTIVRLTFPGAKGAE